MADPILPGEVSPAPSFKEGEIHDKLRHITEEMFTDRLRGRLFELQVTGSPPRRRSSYELFLQAHDMFKLKYATSIARAGDDNVDWQGPVSLVTTPTSSISIPTPEDPAANFARYVLPPNSTPPTPFSPAPKSFEYPHFAPLPATPPLKGREILTEFRTSAPIVRRKSSPRRKAPEHKVLHTHSMKTRSQAKRSPSRKVPRKISHYRLDRSGRRAVVFEDSKS